MTNNRSDRYLPFMSSWSGFLGDGDGGLPVLDPSSVADCPDPYLPLASSWAAFSEEGPHESTHIPAFDPGSVAIPLIMSDKDWVKHAPERPGEDLEFHGTLLRASHNTPIFNEDIKRSLEALSKLGLVVEVTCFSQPLGSNDAARSLDDLSKFDVLISATTTWSSQPLAAYITATMNYGLIFNRPCPYRFSLHVSDSMVIDIPTRSRLILLHLQAFQDQRILVQIPRTAQSISVPWNKLVHRYFPSHQFVFRNQ